MQKDLHVADINQHWLINKKITLKVSGQAIAHVKEQYGN